MANPTNFCCFNSCISETPLKWVLGSVAAVAAVVVALAVATLLIPALAALVGLGVLTLYIVLGTSAAVLAAAGAVLFGCREKPAEVPIQPTLHYQLNGLQYDFVNPPLFWKWLRGGDEKRAASAEFVKVSTDSHADRFVNLTRYHMIHHSIVGNTTWLPINYDNSQCWKIWTKAQMKDLVTVATEIVQGQKVLVIGNTLSDEATFMVVVDLVRYAQTNPQAISEASQLISNTILVVQSTMGVELSEQQKQALNSQALRDAIWGR